MLVLENFIQKKKKMLGASGMVGTTQVVWKSWIHLKKIFLLKYVK